MAASCSTASEKSSILYWRCSTRTYILLPPLTWHHRLAALIRSADARHRGLKAIYFGRRCMDHIVMVGTTFIDRWHWIDRCARRAANIRQPHLESTTRLVPLTIPIRE